MIKTILLQHKREKELFSAKPYVPREQLSFARKFIDKDVIKVILGPRRAGKSVFAFLLLKDKPFAYVNFDDDALLRIQNPDEILKGIFEVYPQARFILFDEIQNLANWEVFVSKLHRRGYNLVLTGSNSRLLSRELSTVLTGRHIPIPVLPFSFKEFMSAKQFTPNKSELALPEVKGKLLNLLDTYLKTGGFPDVVVQDLDPKSYLETLFDSVLLKDVVRRYHVRFSQKIYDLSLYVISHFAGEFSFTKLKNVLNFNSVNTLQNYLKYLEEAYLVFLMNRFSFKPKEQIKAPRKIYLVDNGFALAKAFQFTQNAGKLMENLVFVELLKRGYKVNGTLFYYKTRNQREIDFVLREGLRVKTLVQVCYAPDDPDVEKREIKALIEASEELHCKELLVITWDREENRKSGGKKITFVPLWKWLTT